MDETIDAFVAAWLGDNAAVLSEILALQGDDPTTPYGAALAASIAALPTLAPTTSRAHDPSPGLVGRLCGAAMELETLPYFGGGALTHSGNGEPAGSVSLVDVICRPGAEVAAADFASTELGAHGEASRNYRLA